MDPARLRVVVGERVRGHTGNLPWKQIAGDADDALRAGRHKRERETVVTTEHRD